MLHEKNGRIDTQKCFRPKVSPKCHTSFKINKSIRYPESEEELGTEQISIDESYFKFDRRTLEGKTMSH